MNIRKIVREANRKAEAIMKEYPPKSLAPVICWESVAKVFAREIRQARRARNIALRGGRDHISAVEYWERYMAALMKFRTILKAELNPTSNDELRNEGQP